MSAQVRIAGGPHDGQSLTWETANPPDIISLPVSPETPDGPTIVATYWRGRDWHGRTLQADDGALVYEFYSETV